MSLSKFKPKSNSHPTLGYARHRFEASNLPTNVTICLCRRSSTYIALQPSSTISSLDSSATSHHPLLPAVHCPLFAACSSPLAPLQQISIFLFCLCHFSFLCLVLSCLCLALVVWTTKLNALDLHHSLQKPQTTKPNTLQPSSWLQNS